MNEKKSNQQTKVIPAQSSRDEVKKRRTLPDSQPGALDESNRALYERIGSYKKDDLTENEYWERIFYVHLKTKELYILAEEYGTELKTFFLPLNSLKDAYENIIHVCANDYMARTGNGAFNSKYAADNLRSALANECKAFFDTADFLSVLLRKKIGECLNAFTYPQIASVWDGYNDVRLQLIKISQEIADIRTRKSDTNDYYIDEDVEKYYNATKELLSWYTYVEEKVYPKLEQRFNDL